MSTSYEIIIKYIVEEGNKLVFNSKKIPSKKRTSLFKEADLSIERGLKTLISSFKEDYEFFSEEENNLYKKSKNIWVADPISGTQSFLNGLPHYCLVIAHIVDDETRFACIYDPSVNELFTAYVGKGAYLNGKKISVNEKMEKVVVRGVSHYSDVNLVNKILTQTEKEFKIEKSYYSYAFDYCSVASGRISGVISLTKDSFPEFAGNLIVQEAEGIFTNKNGDYNLKETDRIFVLGSQKMYPKLFDIITDPHV